MSGITRLILLGTGSSGGVPRANGDWGACDPENPKNRRRRCSALFERAASKSDLDEGEKVTRVVIDTAPDFREQMISETVPRLDGVVFTHDHADQTHGLDDLRSFALLQRQRIPVWMDAATRKTLFERFSYAFISPPGSPYPAILDARAMPDPGQILTIDGPGGEIAITPFIQQHGGIMSLGFLSGGIAYSADISGLPADSAAIIENVACWAVDALRDEPHPTHFHVEAALQALQRVKARRGVLTNMHITLDYEELSARLPDHVTCGFDGMHIEHDESGLRLS